LTQPWFANDGPEFTKDIQMKLRNDLATAVSRSPQQARTTPQMSGAWSTSGYPCPTAIRSEYARLSARAAQARGRGEWVLAAQVAAQMTALDNEFLSPQGR
jgi:hypothetical protein